MDFLDILYVLIGFILGCALSKYRNLDELNEKQDKINDLKLSIDSIKAEKDYFKSEYKIYKEKDLRIQQEQIDKNKKIENSARSAVSKRYFNNNNDAYEYYKGSGGTNDLNSFLFWYASLEVMSDSSSYNNYSTTNNYDDDTKNSYSSSSYDSGSSYSSDSYSSSSSDSSSSSSD